MGTKITPYVSSDDEAKKNQVERMFDGIAHRYDFLNHFFSLGIDVLWRKTCIRILRRSRRQTLGRGHRDRRLRDRSRSHGARRACLGGGHQRRHAGRGTQKSGGPGMERPH